MKVERTMVVDTLEQMCDLMCGESEEHDFCLRCGRRLKNPEARVMGYGNVCYKKMLVESSLRKPLF